MKIFTRIIFGLSLLCMCLTVNAQIADFESTTDGMLIPRMTTAQKDAITNLSQSLLVYDTDTKSFWYYEDMMWNELAAGESSAGFSAGLASPNAPIIDGDLAGVSSTITLSSLGTITAETYIEICVNIDHPFSGDVDISLTASDGTTILDLASDLGGGNNYMNTCFTTSASEMINTAAAPYAGNFIPEAAFSGLINQTIAGDWILNVLDDDGSFVDNGTFVSWSIAFQNGNVAPISSGGGCNEYGDSSAGDVTIGSADWSTTPPANGNYMFQNLTITGTLTVASGTIIKVAQTFDNQGTIIVKEGIPGERWVGSLDGGFPRTKGNTLSFNNAYSQEQLRFLSSSSLIAGGSPGSDGGSTGLEAEGGFGGGALSIKAIDIINSGAIRSNGGNGAILPPTSNISGCGGGGGGFIILQGNNISNTGTIETKGGDGGSPGQAGAELAGGGGGGGLIHLISPNASSVGGTLTVDGGAAGTAPSGNTGASGGGAGGAGAGNAGYGGFSDFASPPNITPAETGSIGVVLRTQVADPCSFSN